MIIAIGVDLSSLKTENTVDLGKRIEMLRTQQGMSQNDLAKRIGTSQNTIHKIENGETKRSGYIPAIAAELGFSAEELISGAVAASPDVTPMQAKLIRKIKDANEQDLTEIEEVMNAVLKIAELKRKAQD